MPGMWDPTGSPQNNKCKISLTYPDRGNRFWSIEERLTHCFYLADHLQPEKSPTARGKQAIATRRKAGALD